LLSVAWAIGPQSPAVGTLLILHTNDIHAHIKSNSEGLGGMAVVKAILDSARRGRTDALVLDAGDLIKKGDLMSENTKGKALFQVFNRLGYDATTFGNNEFKYDYEALISNLAMCSTKVINCNATLAGGGYSPRGWLGDAPVLLKTVNGFRVAVIGGIYPLDTTELTEARGKGKVEFDELVPAMRRQVRGLKGKTDVLVALTHIGFEADKALAESIPELDVIVGGHSHTRLDSAWRRTPGRALIVQAGSYARDVGWLTLTIARANDSLLNWRSGLIPVDANLNRPDSALLRYIQKLDAQYAPGAAETLADTPERIAGLDVLGGWTADAFCAATKCDIGLADQGTCIEPIYRGVVTVEDIYKKSPYPGKLVTFKAKGKELRAAVEHALALEGAPVLGISGFTYSYNPSAAKGKWLYSISLDPAKSYTVVANDWVVKNAQDYLGQDVKYEATDITVVDAQLAYCRKVKTLTKPKARVIVISQD
jgi:2',3'-cyclic-nucleotide 2'-phosphodiesterase (5'-nucleotidase family)